VYVADAGAVVYRSTAAARQAHPAAVVNRRAFAGGLVARFAATAFAAGVRTTKAR